MVPFRISKIRYIFYKMRPGKNASLHFLNTLMYTKRGKAAVMFDECSGAESHNPTTYVPTASASADSSSSQA